MSVEDLSETLLQIKVRCLVIKVAFLDISKHLSSYIITFCFACFIPSFSFFLYLFALLVGL